VNPWGKLRFGAASLQKVRDYKDPGFSIIYAKPAADGAWTVFGFRSSGQKLDLKKPALTRKWKLFRATTRDGAKYENVETVMETPPARWTDNATLAYNPDAKEYLLLNLKIVDFGFQYTASFSPDGRHWQAYDKNPLFYDADALSLFWSPTAHLFICVSKSLQPYPKHFIDHGNVTPSLHDDSLRDRRVLIIRSSPDGRHWKPDISLKDVWNRFNEKTAEPASDLLAPDADDPPDMEFYSGNGFWYYDRSFLMVLNYAPSPLFPHEHGPHLDTEWWLSRDGLHWDRPWRDVNAIGDSFGSDLRILSNPLVIDDQILFPFNNHLLGMKKDRFSYITARANGEFSTPPFVMPSTGLLLNAAAPSPDRPFATREDYIMAAVLDEKGGVIPGFAADKCVIREADKIDIPLEWKGSALGQLAGRRVSLRFFLRSANIYAVTAVPSK